MQRAVAPYSIESPAQVGLTPEVLDSRIEDVEAVARWMDYAFELPGGFRFGLAGIVGLIPGIGDFFDAIVSLYIVTRAIQLKISRVAVARMLVNIGIEAVAGAVPFAGDLFDVAFKANRRNFVILKNHLTQPQRQGARDWFFLLIAVGLAVLAIALPVVGVMKLLEHRW